jgi:hypothetical protein
MNIDGLVNNEIQKRLKLYVPMTDVMFKISI